MVALSMRQSSVHQMSGLDKVAPFSDVSHDFEADAQVLKDATSELERSMQVSESLKKKIDKLIQENTALKKENAALKQESTQFKSAGANSLALFSLVSSPEEAGERQRERERERIHTYIHIYNFVKLGETRRNTNQVEKLYSSPQIKKRNQIKGALLR